MKRKAAQEVAGSPLTDEVKSSTRSRAARRKAGKAAAKLAAAAEAPAESPKKKRRKDTEAAEQGEANAAPEAGAAAAAGDVEKRRRKDAAKETIADSTTPEPALSKAAKKKRRKDAAKATKEDSASAATAEPVASKEAYSTVAGEEGYEAHLAAVAKVAAANPAVQESLTVFLGGFPFETPKSQLYLDFGGGGKIMKLVIPRDADGSRQGVAFITYKTKADVDAVCKLDRTEYGGRILKINRVAPKDVIDGKGKGKGDKPKASFDHEVSVRGLPWTTTSQQLRNHFETCGEVVNLKLLYNQEGKVRGTAFIAFKGKDALKKAIELNNTEFGGRTIYVCRAGDFGSKGKDGKAKGKSKGKHGGNGS